MSKQTKSIDSTLKEYFDVFFESKYSDSKDFREQDI